MKLCITISKYVTQALYNHKRGSTEGWSIFNILCDFTGGTLSVLQGVVSAIACGESPFGGALNVVKYLLGIFTIIFDIIFILQHYVFFKGKKPVIPFQQFDWFIGWSIYYWLSWLNELSQPVVDLIVNSLENDWTRWLLEYLRQAIRFSWMNNKNIDSILTLSLPHSPSSTFTT